VYNILRRDSFVKKAKKFFKKHPQLKEKFKKVILNLENNPFEPSLKTHKLGGKLNDLYSCSLNYEYRIILSIVIIENNIYLVDIGSHDEVY